MAHTAINEAAIPQAGGVTKTPEKTLGRHPVEDRTPKVANNNAKAASVDPRPGCVTRGRGIRPWRGGAEGRGETSTRWTTQWDKKMGGIGRGSSKVTSVKKGASASAGQRSKKAAAFAARKEAAEEVGIPSRIGRRRQPIIMSKQHPSTRGPAASPVDAEFVPGEGAPKDAEKLAHDGRRSGTKKWEALDAEAQR